MSRYAVVGGPWSWHALSAINTWLEVESGSVKMAIVKIPKRLGCDGFVVRPRRTQTQPVSPADATHRAVSMRRTAISPLFATRTIFREYILLPGW